MNRPIAIPLLFGLLACGGDDTPERETTGAPSTRSDASPAEAATSDAGANSAPDGGSTGADARDGGSTSGDAGATAPLTLERALDPTGIDVSTERAMLVIDAACMARVPCGQGGASFAECVDLTLNEWALGALFFSEECIDAQVDLYACLATPSCDAQSGCTAERAAQATFCALEQ